MRREKFVANFNWDLAFGKVIQFGSWRIFRQLIEILL